MSLKSKTDEELMILFDNDPNNEKNAEILKELNSRGLYHKIKQPLNNTMKGIVMSKDELKVWEDKHYPNRKKIEIKTSQGTLMMEFSKLTPDYTLQLIPDDYIENPTKHDGFKIIATHNKTKKVITQGYGHGGFSPITPSFPWRHYGSVISIIANLCYPDHNVKSDDLHDKMFTKLKELNGYVETKGCAACGTY